MAANMKAVKLRIKSVESTMQITSDCDPEFYAGSRQRNGCDHAGLD